MKDPLVIVSRFQIADAEASLLGQGGMSKVFLAKDLQTGQDVAVKILNSEIAALQPSSVARFFREGEALRQLNHPNIVKMITTVEENHKYYLVMDYIPGGSLEHLLKSKLPLKQVLEIGLDLADALTRAHRLGIIHRDLKPSNVLISAEGKPLLSDFGIALFRHQEPITQGGLIIGTMDYLSPEACRGEPLDARSDIWAFGILLYEMLSGERPFAGRDLTSTLSAILTQPVPDLNLRSPEAPDSLVDLVYRMVEKDSQQRIRSVRLVGAELERILHSHTHQAMTFHFTKNGKDDTAPTQIGHARSHLPQPPSPFIGRDKELVEIAQLLKNPEVRLLTIHAEGGMGKTRLALQSGLEHQGDFPNGVFFISLTPFDDLEAILPALGNTFGFGKTLSMEQIQDFLREKHLLLILDNCEQVLDIGHFIHEILQSAPKLKVMATSRTRLNLQFEQVLSLGGMDLPCEPKKESVSQNSCIQLFLQGARRIQPKFELQPEDMKAVVHLCRLVEGMPLAILLAAAWVEMLSLPEIAAEIEKNTDILESSLSDLPERQRSLRHVFDYSWALLSPTEKQLMQALSVFRGGFTRQAAQEISGGSLRNLMTLINKSWLHRTPSGRFEIHELLRQPTERSLEASPEACDAIRSRYSTHYLRLLAQLESLIQGQGQREAIDTLTLEFENIRSAWHWAISHRKTEDLLSAVMTLVIFSTFEGRQPDIVVMLEAALDKLRYREFDPIPAPGQSDHPLAARLWASLCIVEGGRCAMEPEPIERCIQRLQTLITQSTHTEDELLLERALLHLTRGWALFIKGELEEAVRILQKAETYAHKAKASFWEARISGLLGFTLHNLGQLDEALKQKQQALEIYRAQGDELGMVDSLSQICQTIWVMGEFDTSEVLARENLALSKKAGHGLSTANVLGRLGEVLVRKGDFAEGQELLLQSKAAFMEIGCYKAAFLDIGFYFDPSVMELFLAEAYAYQGLYDLSLAASRQALERFQRFAFPWNAGFANYTMGLALLGMGQPAQALDCLQVSCDIFQRGKEHDNLGWALGLAGLAHIQLGQPVAGRKCLSRALYHWKAYRSWISMLYALPGALLLFHKENDGEAVRQIYSLAGQRGFLIQSRWFEDVALCRLRQADGLPASVLSIDIPSVVQWLSEALEQPGDTEPACPEPDFSASRP